VDWKDVRNFLKPDLAKIVLFVVLLLIVSFIFNFLVPGAFLIQELYEINFVTIFIICLFYWYLMSCLFVYLSKRKSFLLLVVLAIFLFFITEQLILYFKEYYVSYLVDSGKLEVACSLDPLHTRMLIRPFTLLEYSCKKLRNSNCQDPNSIALELECYPEFYSVYDVCKSLDINVLKENLSLSTRTVEGCLAYCCSR